MTSRRHRTINRTSRRLRLGLYNRRSELAAAQVGTNRYAYDNIGNSIYAAFNGLTNTYTANKFQLEHRGL